MKLLNLTTIKRKENKEAKERIDIITKLNKAETEQAQRLNAKREFVDREIKLLDLELEDHRVKVSEEKKNLTSEVLSLESRRSDAMKPINEHKKEAESKMQEALGKEKEIERREQKVTEQEEILLERIDSISNRDQEQNEREESLNTREVKIKSQEEANKQSTLKLNKEWAELHAKTHEINADIARREKQIIDGERANDAIRDSLNKKEEENRQYKRQLLDERQTLDRLWNELERKQQAYDRDIKKRQ